MTTITLQLSPELEHKLRESIARRDAQSIRQLLADAFAPTVEALLEQTPTQFNDMSKDEEDDIAWHRLAAEQLLKGYSEEDAIYDTI